MEVEAFMGAEVSTAAAVTADSVQLHQTQTDDMEKQTHAHEEY